MKNDSCSEIDNSLFSLKGCSVWFLQGPGPLVLRPSWWQIRCMECCSCQYLHFLLNFGVVCHSTENYRFSTLSLLPFDLAQSYYFAFNPPHIFWWQAIFKVVNEVRFWWSYHLCSMACVKSSNGFCANRKTCVVFINTHVGAHSFCSELQTPKSSTNGWWCSVVATSTAVCSTHFAVHATLRARHPPNARRTCWNGGTGAMPKCPLTHHFSWTAT